jgi:hypothetical protein
MIAEIVKTHKETANIAYPDKNGGTQPRKGGAQIVFSAVGLGEQAAQEPRLRRPRHIDDTLMKGGIKKAEIGWMSDANTHAKKEQLQKDVRAGKVRCSSAARRTWGPASTCRTG